MFNSLVESGSHRADLRRKSKFFLGATAFYALLLAVTGVGSIYAYNATIDDRSELEVLSIMRFSPAEARPEPARREEQRPAPSNGRESQAAMRVDELSVITPLHGDRVASANAKDINARTPVVFGPINREATTAGGPAHTNYAGGPGGPGGDIGPPRVDDNTTPPPLPPRTAPTPAPAEHKGPLRLTSTLLASKIVSKPAPPYPALAKQLGVQGSVTVQFLIDEQGRVVNAKATSGHPLLQAAAVKAAYTATFTPTVLSGKPTTVTGVITYNFVLNN